MQGSWTRWASWEPAGVVPLEKPLLEPRTVCLRRGRTNLAGTREASRSTPEGHGDGRVNQVQGFLTGFEERQRDNANGETARDQRLAKGEMMSSGEEEPRAGKKAAIGGVCLRWPVGAMPHIGKFLKPPSPGPSWSTVNPHGARSIAHWPQRRPATREKRSRYPSTPRIDKGDRHVVWPSQGRIGSDLGLHGRPMNAAASLGSSPNEYGAARRGIVKEGSSGSTRLPLQLRWCLRLRLPRPWSLYWKHVADMAA